MQTLGIVAAVGLIGSLIAHSFYEAQCIEKVQRSNFSFHRSD